MVSQSVLLQSLGFLSSAQFQALSVVPHKGVRSCKSSRRSDGILVGKAHQPFEVQRRRSFDQNLKFAKPQRSQFKHACDLFAKLEHACNIPQLEYACDIHPLGYLNRSDNDNTFKRQQQCRCKQRCSIAQLLDNHHLVIERLW
jgi:hypothetical protein